MTDEKQKKFMLDKSGIHLLHRASQRAGDIFAEEVGSSTLTRRQYAVLSAIMQNEGLSQTDIVDMTGIDRSTLADIVQRLLNKGLLIRKRTKEDARAYAVRLSAAGRRVLDQARPNVEQAEKRLLANLPKGKKNEFLDLLAHLAAASED